MTKIERLERELQEAKNKQEFQQENLFKIKTLLEGKYFIYGTGLWYFKELRLENGDFIRGNIEKIIISNTKYFQGFEYVNTKFETLSSDLYKHEENIVKEVTKDTFMYWKKVCASISRNVGCDMLNKDINIEHNVHLKKTQDLPIYDFKHIALTDTQTYKLSNCPYLLPNNILIASESVIDWLTSKYEEDRLSWNYGSEYYTTKEVEWVRSKLNDWEAIINLVKKEL